MPSHLMRRPPDERELAAEPLLALLVVTDTVLCALAHSLRATQPEIDKPPRPGDDGELTAAREIVDAADLLLYQLDLLGEILRDRIRYPLRDNWPF